MGQHAFYQYLHQSNNVVPADFIGSVESVTPVQGHHETLMANFFAQTEALMSGGLMNSRYVTILRQEAILNLILIKWLRIKFTRVIVQLTPC